MHYSKKSLSLVSVATIALFTSLSQNSIAASNVDSGAPSTSSRPLFKTHHFDLPHILEAVGDALSSLHATPEERQRIYANRMAERAQERQEELAQRLYTDAMQQQQFMNRLALHRDRLATKDYQLKKAALISRYQADPTAISSIFSVAQGRSPVVNKLARISGSRGLPSPSTPTPAPKTPATPANTENNRYDIYPLIDPANFTGELRNKFDRLKTYHPDTFQRVISAANYDIPLAEAAKDVKDAREIDAIKRAVYAANPEYDMSTAASVEQLREEMKDPKSKWAQLAGLDELRSKNLDLAYLAEKLPNSGFPIVNYCIVDPLTRLFHPQDIDAYESALHQYAEAFQRVRGISWQDIEARLPAYKGTHTIKSLLKGHGLEFNRQVVYLIKQAHHLANGHGGFRAEDISEGTLKYLVDSGFVTIKRGYVVPTPAKY